VRLVSRKSGTAINDKPIEVEHNSVLLLRPSIQFMMKKQVPEGASGAETPVQQPGRGRYGRGRAGVGHHPDVTQGCWDYCHSAVIG
jgi:hypothetical protein